MDHDVSSILWLTTQVSGCAVLIAAIIGVPLGGWLGSTSFPGRKLVWALVYTGMAFPPVVIGLLVYLLLSRSGPLGVIEWLYTPKAMILAQVVLGLPFVVGITMTAVAAVPRELSFQLQTLGASERQARWTILGEARNGVLLAIATAFGRSVSEVGAVWIVGGNIQGHTRVLTTAIILETGKGEFTLALFLGAILLTIALLVNVLILRFHGRPLP
ncbi:MAG: ABC transporter permease [Burkholderiales bacterium]